MAVTTIVHCDRCGGRITQERVVLKPTLGRLKQREPFDLCPECSDALLDWFGPMCGRKPDAPADPPSPPADGPKPRPKGKGKGKSPGDRPSPP